ncbi:hypothetical protein GUITHDRAFT_151652 [Guillardia theta CCMP2712]|uniref:Uncharacterized protein n=2 Tax=Guillardia theta TaxID=55529 RepID=L1JK07_GUITC|nr:hypothetical protein GUITHDRAFT_151652 [Guillardia theta CCMP2712]EKX48672.1 hypothetical protein GUITHDRAFT_151652 [Guillardia theta CCMP2712]|eukprot:XP_005835652.1 hypothetical protein GUITHDRAFT_151652 [Guillardia theta CCMP2712]
MVWKKYQALLQSKGIVGIGTKAVTSAAIAFAGDVFCQTVLERQTAQQWTGELSHMNKTESKMQVTTIDWKRLSNFTLLGGVLVAPTLHYWYGFLGRAVPGTNFAAAFKRVFLDQAFFAPSFIAVFISSVNALDGKSQEEVVKSVQTHWGPSVINNWKLWIPAQFVNLWVVPPHLQVLFSNGVAVIWNMYLSWVTHRPAQQD